VPDAVLVKAGRHDVPGEGLDLVGRDGLGGREAGLELGDDGPQLGVLLLFLRPGETHERDLRPRTFRQNGTVLENQEVAWNSMLL